MTDEPIKVGEIAVVAAKVRLRADNLEIETRNTASVGGVEPLSNAVDAYRRGLVDGGRTSKPRSSFWGTVFAIVVASGIVGAVLTVIFHPTLLGDIQSYLAGLTLDKDKAGYERAARWTATPGW